MLGRNPSAPPLVWDASEAARVDKTNHDSIR
jgi:hypothetical protein